MGGACDKNQGDRLTPPISHMESDLARVAAEIRAKPRPSAAKTVRANLPPNEDEDEDEEHPVLERMGREFRCALVIGCSTAGNRFFSAS